VWYALFWAAVKIGALPVPFDPQTGEWELRNLLSLTEVKLCVITPQFRANRLIDHMTTLRSELPGLCRVVVDGALSDDGYFIPLGDFIAKPPILPAIPPAAVDYDDTLMYACTSGTTGNPKIIAVPHGGFHKAQKDMAGYLGLSPADTMLVGMPLFHQGGFGMGLQTILGGGSVVYQSKFDPNEFLRSIETNRVTAIQLTATLAKIILSAPEFDAYDFSSVRLCYFAGEVVPDEVAHAFCKDRNIRVVNIIGSTETATMVIWDSYCDMAFPVNEYRPLGFTEVRIVDKGDSDVLDGETGEIMVCTDAVVQHFHKNPAETSARIRFFDGKRWLRTGDLAVRTPAGRIRFVGRAKRIIKRGANLVYPEEVESFLLTHPAVHAVAVVKEFHEVFGEKIVAHVQPQAENRELSRGELLAFCKGRLASYKIPDTFIVNREIPKEIGKVQFKYLRSCKGMHTCPPP
jgi:fatty-acyl-CoA synthase